MKRRAWPALALAALAACSQVGREIVGEQPGRLDGERDCSKPRRCGQLEVEPPQVLPDAAGPVDLSGCAVDEPRCPVGSACASDEASDDALRLAWSGDQLASLICTRARLASGDEAGAVLRAERSVLRRVNLRVTSSQPASIELTRAELASVAFELHGPVTLRLVDSVKLDDVRVTADGAAQIVIEGGHADGLALAADSGRADLRRLTLRHLRAQIAQLNLESVELRSAEISGARFEATDATLDHLTVRVDRVLLSASTVNMSDFGACTAFSGIAGSFVATHVSACQEPHRIYGSMFSASRVDGALMLDRSALSLTEIGVADAGPAEIWDSELRNVTFCADQQAFAFGGRSTVVCGHCDLAEAPVQPTACFGSMANLNVESTESCMNFEEPLSCGFSRPERMRPPL